MEGGVWCMANLNVLNYSYNTGPVVLCLHFADRLVRLYRIRQLA